MWFIANIFFKTQSASMPEIDLVWEERFVFIAADKEVDAMEKAIRYGKSQEHSYTNMRMELIEWKFDSVKCFQLDTLGIYDELEIFSRFLSPSDVASLKAPFEDNKELTSNGAVIHQAENEP